jgi:hypothetical protein
VLVFLLLEIILRNIIRDLIKIRIWKGGYIFMKNSFEIEITEEEKNELCRLMGCLEVLNRSEFDDTLKSIVAKYQQALERYLHSY